MSVVLTREYRLHCTLGVLEVEGSTFKTIERPWLNNAPNRSCIPAGKYHCNYLKRSLSGKYKRVWHLQDVSNRSGILIHKGNLVSHSLGCIIVGLSHGYLNGYEAVLSSSAAFSKLRSILGNNNFDLIIK